MNVANHGIDRNFGYERRKKKRGKRKEKRERRKGMKKRAREKKEKKETTKGKRKAVLVEIGCYTCNYRSGIGRGRKNQGIRKSL